MAQTEGHGDGSHRRRLHATGRGTRVRGTRRRSDRAEDQTVSGLNKMKHVRVQVRFALCIRTDGAVDLERRKVYQVMPDREASRSGYMRVVDESGEDYLYPAAYFVPVRLPAAVRRDLETANLAHGPANSAQQTDSTRSRVTRPRLHAARG